MERILTELEASAMFGSTDTQTGVTIPGVFTSPWGRDRNRTDARLIDVARLGNNFRVYLVDANDDAIGIRAGRCTIAGVVLAYSGADPAVDGLTDDATTLVWVYDDSGTATIGSGDAWPTDPHVKLAEVTMADGEITTILDRRAEAVFQDATPNEEITNADIAADAGIVRSKLVLETSARLAIPLVSVRAVDFAALLPEPDSGSLGLEYDPGNTLLLVGLSADNSINTNRGLIDVGLPLEYEAGSNITLALHAWIVELTSAPDIITSTLDAEVFKIADDGTLGADLCTTTVKTLTAAPTDHLFTITGTGLVRGDRLLVRITTVCTTSSGHEIRAEIGSVELRLSIRG